MYISEILSKNKFVPKKKYGQNFITDNALLDSIVDDASITGDDCVVEVGAGAGTLTSALAAKAKRVVAFEIDETLGPVLCRTVGERKNVEVVFRDILKVKPAELADITGGPFKVVANLPYYITSPVLFYFLENEFPLISLTVMVQREVALRMVAQPDTPDYGALSLAVASRADAEITRSVSRKLFYPQPNVDSAVVKLTMNEGIKNREAFDKLVRCAFSCRRKTFVNNLMQSFGLSRSAAEKFVTDAGLDAKIRGEALGLEQFIELAERFSISAKAETKIEN